MDISFQETGVVKQKEDIIIRRGIVHILDATLGYPVYSEQELDLTPDINDFFRSHAEQHIFTATPHFKSCHAKHTAVFTGMRIKIAFDQMSQRIDTSIGKNLRRCSL